MPFVTPVGYLRRRSAIKQSSKPTAVSKISTRPYIQPQRSSPLFRLPAELRLQIFSYALLAYLDPSKPYSRHTYFYRPGHTHKRSITTALLLTCRRIYLETSLLPLEVNEHIVYGCEKSHAPLTYRAYLFPDCTLRTVQREAIRRVHIFAHQNWLENWYEKGQWGKFCRSWDPSGRQWSAGYGRSMSGECKAGLEELRVTIRHTDWWYYVLGSFSPLALDPRRAGRADRMLAEPLIDFKSGADNNGERENLQRRLLSEYEEGSWGSDFVHFHHLKIFELELETLDSKRKELDAFVALARSWMFPLGNGNVLMLEPKVTKMERWIGSSCFKGATYAASLAVQESSTLIEGISHVRKRSAFSWMSRVANRTEGAESSSEDGDVSAAGTTLEYYVVTLTWRARRPEDVTLADSRGSTAAASAGVCGNVQAIDIGSAAPHTGPARATGRDVIPSYWG